ncbi:hypothetical protein GE118_00490 [Mycoplasma sp. NEAQ87857]|uniref:hypothetical protein n=1 Tax=Mycoplasma sp. NEAQ87857 TaxID=2683967 RepID=UPI001317947D|nr:hypothetical protein [Mycoplasma sp. NEAQ87857]QGZ97282.1 hypothetical protein GE118_00490 [Mycoplasma sp. NEAQ87857]
MFKKLSKIKIDIFSLLITIISILTLVLFSLITDIKQNIPLFSLLISTTLILVFYSLFNVFKSIHLAKSRQKLNKMFKETTSLYTKTNEQHEQILAKFLNSQIELNSLIDKITKADDAIEKEKTKAKELSDKKPEEAKVAYEKINSLNIDKQRFLKYKEFYLEQKTIKEKYELQLEEINQKLKKINENELVKTNLNTISSYKFVDVHKRTIEWKTLLNSQNKILLNYKNELDQTQNKLIKTAKELIERAKKLDLSKVQDKSQTIKDIIKSLETKIEAEDFVNLNIEIQETLPQIEAIEKKLKKAKEEQNNSKG